MHFVDFMYFIQERKKGKIFLNCSDTTGSKPFRYFLSLLFSFPFFFFLEGGEGRGYLSLARSALAPSHPVFAGALLGLCK